MSEDIKEEFRKNNDKHWNMLHNIHLGLFCLLAPLILFSSCFDDSSTNPNDLNDTGFPLAIGNRWEYAKTTEYTEFASEDTLYEASTAVWEITGLENINGIEAYRMEVHMTSVEGPNAGMTGLIVNWYAVMGDTLKWIAYSEHEGFHDYALQLAKPAIEPPVMESIGGGWQNMVLIFPLKKGKQWTMNSKSDKTVRNYEKVTTPAGIFEGYKISQDLTPQNEYFHELNRWYGTVGLLRHEEYGRQTRLSEDELSMVSSHFHSVVELTSFTLN